jgi:colanic acid/amylovoran biosynthesis glycosyltransferase
MNASTTRLLIVSSRAPFGNAEPYLRTELDELSRHFKCIALVCARTPRGPEQSLPANVRVLRWPLLSFEILRRSLLVLVSRPAARRTAIATLFSKERGRLKNLAILLKALALGQWAIENRITHVHAYWLSVPATVAMLAAESAGIPWSATAHRWDIYERNALDAKSRSVAFVRAISKRGAETLREAMPGARQRIVHLPLGAVIPALLDAPSAPQGRFSILCPAALVQVKGHSDLFAAVGILVERGIPVHCRIAGEGPLRAALADFVTRMQLQAHIEFCGFVPQHQLHEWYRSGAVDAVVLASRHEADGLMEGVPSALMEAMARGVPVVATDSGSVGELVDPKCGSLVAPGDSRALADALENVYRDRAGARERALNAYRRVARLHDVRRQMASLATLVVTQRALA